MDSILHSVARGHRCGAIASQVYYSFIFCISNPFNELNKYIILI